MGYSYEQSHSGSYAHPYVGGHVGWLNSYAWNDRIVVTATHGFRRQACTSSQYGSHRGSIGYLVTLLKPCMHAESQRLAGDT